MKQQILEKLKEIEEKRGFDILFACESGSRAWGFPSPDSDYDVRIVYKRDLDWYLSTQDKRKDYIQPIFDGDLDISGWDLKKTLQLLRSSNAGLFDWLHSPVVYRADEAFLTGIRDLSKECFSPIGMMFHYLSMAKKYYEACNTDDHAKLKKYFYALRTTLNCLWIKEKRTAPPVLFQNMLVLLNEKPSIKARIEELLELKKTKDESFLFQRDSDLLAFVKDSIDQCDAIAKQLPGGKANPDKVDAFFRQTLRF